MNLHVGFPYYLKPLSVGFWFSSLSCYFRALPSIIQWLTGTDIDPTLLQQPFDGMASVNSSNSAFSGIPPSFQQPAIHPPSPALSDLSNHDSHRGSLTFPSRHASPHVYHPYPSSRLERRNSATSRGSRYSHDSPRSVSLGFDEEGKEKGRCPHPDCGRLFKDLKAHMLTHQSERPEKCPIVTCVYHTKGFARKYDRCRHTLTHYKRNYGL